MKNFCLQIFCLDHTIVFVSIVGKKYNQPLLGNNGDNWRHKGIDVFLGWIVCFAQPLLELMIQFVEMPQINTPVQRPNTKEHVELLILTPYTPLTYWLLSR